MGRARYWTLVPIATTQRKVTVSARLTPRWEVEHTSIESRKPSYEVTPSGGRTAALVFSLYEMNPNLNVERLNP
jgi:hypothetical protein